MNWVMYDVEPHVAEIYDQIEADTSDVALIRKLIAGRETLRILEPFCGTGRILIPLATDGHTLVGLDQARGMLDRARLKIACLPETVQRRITLEMVNVPHQEWPQGFDLVILGGNCFYELATPEEQASCIVAAATSLKLGGYIYVDNNHMEGELDETWRVPGVRHGAFPSGTCADGTRLESSVETVWYDAPRRLVRFRRRTRVTFADGHTVAREYEQQKHPVSTGEAQDWLETHGFVIEGLYGDRVGNPYSETAERAIFWARRVGHGEEVQREA